MLFHELNGSIENLSANHPTFEIGWMKNWSEIGVRKDGQIILVFTKADFTDDEDILERCAKEIVKQLGIKGYFNVENKGML